MDDRVIRFRVGVVVLAAAAITCILIMLLGEGRAFFQRRYTIFLGFPQAPGVTVDTPVRKNGVLIGRVARVTLEEQGGVRLTVWIDSQHTLRNNEVCRIGTSSFFGDAVLEFVPRSEQGASADRVQPGDFLADGIVATDPLKVLTNLEGSVQGTIQSIQKAADELAVLARNVNETIGTDKDRFQRLINKSELAIDTFRTTMGKIDELFGDPQLRDQLKQSLADLPAVFNDVRTTLADTHKVLAGFDRVSSKAEKNLDNLEALTRPLAERGAKLTESFENTVQNLDELLAQLVQFSRAINSEDGSIGRLLRDQEIYDRLVRSATNVEMATRRIRPILDDVRTFTDKIATDPRQLGVKGALDRRPLGVGIKSPLYEDR